jgi:hypothetical protein
MEEVGGIAAEVAKEDEVALEEDMMILAQKVVLVVDLTGPTTGTEIVEAAESLQLGATDDRRPLWWHEEIVVNLPQRATSCSETVLDFLWTEWKASERSTSLKFTEIEDTWITVPVVVMGCLLLTAAVFGYLAVRH